MRIQIAKKQGANGTYDMEVTQKTGNDMCNNMLLNKKYAHAMLVFREMYTLRGENVSVKENHNNFFMLWPRVDNLVE